MSMSVMLRRSVVLLSLALLLCRCALFKEDTAEKPTPLKSFESKTHLSLIWSKSLGTADDNVTPAVYQNSLYTVSHQKLRSIDLKTGALRWEVLLPAHPSSAVASNGSLVVVALDNSHLNVYAADTGRLAWSVETPNLVAARPAINDSLMLVKTIDDTVIAFDLLGKLLWQDFHTLPDLTLHGMSAPHLLGETALVGFSDGHLARYALASGKIIWTIQVAEPQGTFPVQRLVDIVATPIVSAGRIFTVTYQGKMASFSAQKGDLIWAHPLSAITGLCVTNRDVVTTDHRGEVWAFDKRDGQVHWHQSDLRYRDLSAPVCLPEGVVVGDSAGYLHALSVETGQIIGRLSVGDGAFKTDLVPVSADRLVASTQKAYVLLARLSS